MAEKQKLIAELEARARKVRLVAPAQRHRHRRAGRRRARREGRASRRSSSADKRITVDFKLPAAERASRPASRSRCSPPAGGTTLIAARVAQVDGDTVTVELIDEARPSRATRCGWSSQGSRTWCRCPRPRWSSATAPRWSSCSPTARPSAQGHRRRPLRPTEVLIWQRPRHRRLGDHLERRTRSPTAKKPPPRKRRLHSPVLVPRCSRTARSAGAGLRYLRNRRSTRASSLRRSCGVRVDDLLGDAAERLEQERQVGHLELARDGALGLAAESRKVKRARVLEVLVHLRVLGDVLERRAACARDRARLLNERQRLGRNLLRARPS